MCGITGVVWANRAEPVDSETLDRMTDILRHRGPDGRGTYLRSFEDGSGVGLGHRRLAIIDPARGAQPMSNEARTVWITYNGEFYNYREVRDKLVACGHCFRTDCDTEVLLHLYEEKGVDCLEEIRGMFAFAIWDEPRRRLFLARDRLGKKPLVYHEAGGRLLFASEIKSLLQVPGVPREVDPPTIDAYLSFLYVPHPQTIFKGIRKLPPAHYAVYQQGRLQVGRYWGLECNGESSDTAEHLRERLREELSESVRLRLRSDVPLGAFLSGGIDSTAIVGLAQRHLPRPVKTFTIGFPVASHDESRYGRTAADHLRTDHHEAMVEPDAVGILPKLVWHFDEPFGDGSAVPTYYVAQAARQQVKVALTGDGGDELFAGYPRYRTAHAMGLFDRLPNWLKWLTASALWRHLPARPRESSIARRLKSRIEALRRPAHERLSLWVTIFQKSLRHQLYSPDFEEVIRSSQAANFVASTAAMFEGRVPGKQAMLVDLLTYLPCDLLAKVDITSMAHGLECRCPFLDHRIVEIAASIPYRQLVHGNGQKPMLTSTLPEMFPDVLRARKKTGFSMPVGHWFRGQLESFAREVLLDKRSLERGYFRRASMEQLLDEHKSGSWNHGDRIWALLCLELWHSTFVDSRRVPVAPPDGCLSPQVTTSSAYPVS